MIYLDEKQFMGHEVNWQDMIRIIEDATHCVRKNDYAQPIKPYLRYHNPKNRIIAMPAYLGGKFQVAGIKWIASFPDNIQTGMPRAHSTVILNHANTGEPYAVIITDLLSAIRTASVTGAVLDKFFKVRDSSHLTAGITGFGPIGRYHLDMLEKLYGNRIERYRIYDVRPLELRQIPPGYRHKVQIVNNWESSYKEADIFLTCTVSEERYIDEKPKPGSFLANVSLRDFMPQLFPYVQHGIFVDDWDEVCRENTDIEQFSLHCGLTREHVKTITDIICDDMFAKYSPDQSIMFNPMGMAVYDLATAWYYTNYLNNSTVEVERTPSV